MRQQTITWYSPREKLPQDEGLYLVRSDGEFGDPSIDMLYFCKNGRIEDGQLKEYGEGLHPLFVLSIGSDGQFEVEIDEVWDWAEV